MVILINLLKRGLKQKNKMNKIFINLFFFIIICFIILISVLSSIGIETNKFNNIISDKSSQSQNINLKLKTIKFKLDLKELSLFLETKNPRIIFRNISVPAENIKVYVDFLSLFTSKPKIEKISLVLKELDIEQIKKLSVGMKPSNFRSLLNNKIKEGKVITEIEIFLTEQGELKDFIAKGFVRNLKTDFFYDLKFLKTNFSFFTDKNDVLIKNINGYLEDIKISDGDIKLNLENGIILNSNFNSKINFDDNLFKKYERFLNKDKLNYKINNLQADFNNNLFIELDDTYKIKDYNYNISGKLEKSKIKLINPIRNTFIKDKINEINLLDLKIQSVFNPKNFNVNGEGQYSFNGLDFLNMNIENNLKNDVLNLKLNFDYNNEFELNLINYKKIKNSIANITLDFTKRKKILKINNLHFKNGTDSIKINDLSFKENKFFSVKKIKVKTKDNDFSINYEKKILIKGNKFDATNIAKFFNRENKENKFENINSKIEIDFMDMKVPMSEKLQNFKLLGEIKKGQFIKISSKGDFGGNNYLDITMKKDKNTNKRYLEIYSDLTRPLLTEYSFFNGLSGGKLLFNSIFDSSNTYSKLKIENFKVINAPGLIKLLSLADLGGLADLAEGEGLSFETLEIDMEKNQNFLKLNEILALGPSISVLMEGYQDENGLTSLRGTLVPAKTLNKMISKIPVIGNIVIPKEVGEGLFGVSFKMKGPKGKIKTTINPLKTLTPRFIQKIIERNRLIK